MARPIFAPFALQGMQLAEQQQQNAFGRNDTDRLRELQRQQFEEQQRAARAREANSERYSELLGDQNALARERFEAGVAQNSFENTVNVGNLISSGVARPASAPGVLQGILEGAPGANDPMVEAGGWLAQFNSPEARMQQAEEAQRRKNAMDFEAVQRMLSTFGTSPPPGMNISMPGPGGSRISLSGQREATPTVRQPGVTERRAEGEMAAAKLLDELLKPIQPRQHDFYTKGSNRKGILGMGGKAGQPRLASMTNSELLAEARKITQDPVEAQAIYRDLREARKELLGPTAPGGNTSLDGMPGVSFGKVPGTP